MPSDSISLLLIHSQRALHRSQRDLGELLGVSRRTMIRWQSDQSGPTKPQLELLAKQVYPHNAKLAQQIAVAAGQTVESLGLVPPPPKPPPPAPKALPPPPAPALPVAPPPPPPRPLPSTAHLVDSIVCAAAEAAATTPQSIRAALCAAFERACAVSLSVDEVRDGLRAKLPAHTTKRRRRRR